VREHREQPALDVRAPSVDDRKQRDGAGLGLLAGLSWSFERLELAAFGAVEDLPPALAQALANGVSGREVALAPAQDALGDESVGLFSVR